MRGPTHALAGACTAGAFLVFRIPHHYPLIALSAAAGFAALLPDLDNSESTLENIDIAGVRPLKIPAWFVDKLFKHRGFLHSLLVIAILAFVLFGFFPKLPVELGIAILFGYLSHLITDGLTPEGVPWFYPFGGHISLPPKFLAIKTGSFFETIFFIGLLVLYAIFLSQAGYVNLII